MKRAVKRFELQLVGAPDSEIQPSFFQKMVDAMAMSFFKYGRVADAYPAKVDALGSLKLRMEKYEATGNTEFLVDVANFAMIEFMKPRHPEAHYKPTDSDESPGRVWNSGHTAQTANTLDRENNRLGGSSRSTVGGFYKREGD